MRITHPGGRLVVLTTTCALLSLASVATVAAYPITPEGEPLHLRAGATPRLPATASVSSGATSSDPATSIPANAIPVADISSRGTDWIETALTATAAIAVLALAAAALTLTGHRRGSASDPLTRERS